MVMLQITRRNEDRLWDFWCWSAVWGGGTGQDGRSAAGGK